MVNKVDNSARLLEANEFYRMGFDNLQFVSSINGGGTGELLDAVTEKIKTENEEEQADIPRFCIIGQPNVGKSSLVNALIGAERNIVTEIAGTTRDAIHTRYRKFNKDFLLIDTAGIRKKAKVHENLEFYSVIRAINAIDDADVCILLLDAKEGLTQQDLSIFRLAKKKKRGIILVVNKWDLVKKTTETAKEFEDEILKKLAPFNDVPIVFSSVLEKKRIFKILELAIEVHANRVQKIPTSVLNDFMQKVIEQYHPPSYKGRFIKIKYVTQLPIHTPAFAFFCNHPKYIREPYQNYLENQLRERFNFSGAPISLVFKKK